LIGPIIKPERVTIEKEREDMMEYGKLLNRAWTILWNNKFLILLGVLAALGSAGGGGNLNWKTSRPGGNVNILDQNLQLPGLEQELGVLPRLAAVGVAVLIGVAFLVGIVLWALSTVARGGLIAGADAIDAGGASSFAQAFRAGWDKGWTLIAIGILPAIPGLLLALLGAVGAVGYLGFARQNVGSVPFSPNAALVGGLAGLACLLVPAAIVLGLLRTFAERVCMLESMGVFAAYRRGTEVLLQNVGPALVLFLLQLAISIGLGIVLFLPGVVMALCCLLWPVLLLAQGTVAAFFGTMWTLAWREWTRG
jgi:hypothetical protein